MQPVLIYDEDTEPYSQLAEDGSAESLEKA